MWRRFVSVHSHQPLLYIFIAAHEDHEMCWMDIFQLCAAVLDEQTAEMIFKALQTSSVTPVFCHSG